MSGITWEKDHSRSWCGRDPEGYAVARISRWGRGRGRDRGWGWDVNGVASGRAPDPLQARLAAEACYRMAGGRDHGAKMATLHEGGGEMAIRKGTMVGDPAVSYALNQLTKDALVDLVHGLALERLGPGAHGLDVVSLLQEWADGIAQVRRDEVPVSIAEGMKKYRRIEAKERAKHEEGGE